MARLPIPGKDANIWGDVLNAFLRESHTDQGVLKADTVGTSQLQTNAVTNDHIAPDAVNSTSIADGTITEAQLDSNVQTKLNNGGVADATASSKGVVQLAGDLSGTAASPTVANGAITSAKIADGTIADGDISASANIAQSKVANLAADLSGKQPLDSDLTAIAALAPTNDDIVQRKAGAWTNRTPTQFKTDLALTKTDVGLSNVDNTSDANKPISTATQSALDTKPSSATITTIVTLTQAEYTALTPKVATTLYVIIP